jgi:hypothetical protein
MLTGPYYPDERIVAIEYQNGRPHSVWTNHAQYDFDDALDCSDNSVLCYSNTGSPSVYWSKYCDAKSLPASMWIAGNAFLHPNCGKRRNKPRPYMKNGKYRDRYRPSASYRPRAIRRRLARNGIRLLKGPIFLKEGTHNPFDAATEAYTKWCDHCANRVIDESDACHVCGNPDDEES